MLRLSRMAWKEFVEGVEVAAGGGRFAGFEAAGIAGAPPVEDDVAECLLARGNVGIAERNGGEHPIAD